MTERERFEEWARGEWPGHGLQRGQIGRGRDVYLKPDADLAWRAWQAASGGRDYVAARVAGALKNKHGRVVSDLATDDPDVVVRAIVDAALREAEK